MYTQHDLNFNYASDDLVTVIIPCYKQAHFLPTTIESCLNQSYKSLEIIVVDDGSPDDVPKAVRPYKHRVKLIQQDNLGLSEARNTGIKNSTGRYILFLDSDDILASDTISSQVNYLKMSTNTGIVVCENKLFSSVTAKGHLDIFGKWTLFRRNLGLHLCFFNIAPPHAYLSRRETILQNGWFDPQLKACEDYDFWLRAAFNGHIPVYNPTGLVYYRRHPKSMSANLINQYRHDAILHTRLSDLLDQYPEFLHDQRLEVYLAFSAGALLTASRLKDLDFAGLPDNLTASALKRIIDANDIAVLHRSRWNIFTKLFCLRIFFYMRHCGFKDSALKNVIIERVLDIMKEINAPSQNLILVKDLLSTIAIESLDYINERKQLARLLWGLKFRIF